MLVMRAPASSTTRRTVLALGTAAAAQPWLGTAPARPRTDSGEPDEPGITELRRRTSDGSLDAERLTGHYLERIERLDPLLHLVIEVNPDALREALRLDARRRSRGPLHGMPLLLKDMLETADPDAHHGRVAPPYLAPPDLGGLMFSR
ncbi:hypothetical protein STAFG_4614 [Streptomyces afghaniensis 772]|uniref:Amidase domain-containing protein n=2 Tax=Streptomyces afghaniensis TaxID=66865 RepID=S4MFV8_9ACTN|nr:hypothetical protein STAFG_4614 [Streptomyces afghaniensis 772]